MFKVVEFTDDKELAVIPSNWLDGNQCAVWPTTKKETQMTKAVISRAEPADNWPSYPIRVMYESDKYEKCRRKLSKAEVESDLQTDAEDENRKRKRIPTSRYDSDTTSDDYQTPSKGRKMGQTPINTEITTSVLPTPPPRIAVQQQSAVSATQMPSPMQSSVSPASQSRSGQHLEHLQSSISPASQSRSGQHLEHLQSSVSPESQSRSGQHLEYLQSSVSPASQSRSGQHLQSSVSPASQARSGQHLEHLQSSVSSASQSRSGQHREHLQSSVSSASQSRSGQHLQSSVSPASQSRSGQHLQSSVSPASQSHSGQHLQLSVSPASQSRSGQHLQSSVSPASQSRSGQHLQSSSRSGQQSSSRLNTALQALYSNRPSSTPPPAGEANNSTGTIRGQDIFNRQVLTLLTEIRAEQKHQSTVLAQLIRSGEREDAGDLPDGITFPVTSDEELATLEGRLQDPDVKKVVVEHLTAIGGSCVKVMLRRLLKYVISNSLARLYNWTGAKDKKPFQNLITSNVIVRAVRKSFGTTHQHDMEHYVKDWLRNAKDRDGGRSLRRVTIPAATAHELDDDIDDI